MTSKKVYFIMVGVNVLLASAIIGTVVAGDRLLKKQSDAMIAQKLENAVLEKAQVSLVQAKQDLERYSELQRISKQIVPQEKDQAVTIREIVSLADRAGIKIGTIGFPSSTLGNAQKKAETKTEGDDKPAPALPDITQAKPVAGIKGLLELPITVTSDPTRPTTYNQLITFLSSLENNRRTAQVSQINIQPDSKNPSLLGFTLTLTVYIKP